MTAGEDYTYDREQTAASLISPVAATPEENQTFRLARTLLLLSVAKELGRAVTSVDRIGYYDFFADSPFMVIQGDKPRDQADRLNLELAGFEPNRLDYASSGPRFANRRRRLQHDIAILVSRALVEVGPAGYEPTDAGNAIAGRMTSAYADAFRQSSEVVLRRLGNLSAAALERSVAAWLGESWLLIDLLAEVNETTIAIGPSLPPAFPANLPFTDPPPPSSATGGPERDE